MNTLNVFFVFYVLYITTFFFNPCFCEDTDYYSETNDNSLKNIDTAIGKKKGKKSVAIALLSSGLVASIIGVLYYMYKSHNRGRHDWNKDFNFPFFNKQIEYEQPDGEKPSTSTKYKEPLGINKVNIKGKLKENNNDIDIPLKRFNIFMDNVKLAAQHHFNDLSNEQHKYLINDYDYLRKIVQTLDESRDVNISKAQEDIAVLGVEHFLKEQYQQKLI
ncbi:early transcribed membrane protein [Plasmodium berghei]|uniref:Protein UIS3 n=3 Tax=Plasmodium berghei TaxID=5821 RepID=A0A509ARS3_PLABA|nr:early transcribed membrane protein [Plasmodium berghei ANKA]CXJ09519.1 early transcribed membrane protein [Plasmodium berghei]SCM25904.1 early transcribed membrane protein [Plasmodium berghei]SCN28173.1 early transcribed membrane protein [Plasmodium berghei]SCO62376.1 early transcribed membrane protein [Plasmodium berghei]SCO63934.1 early transcribed membrane protein [Plasmodium berghei]|eukprot:XP_034423830.1 early transcribed membrane protein [Plasmodium berghei ANKA]